MSWAGQVLKTFALKASKKLTQLHEYKHFYRSFRCSSINQILKKYCSTVRLNLEVDQGTGFKLNHQSLILFFFYLVSLIIRQFFTDIIFFRWVTLTPGFRTTWPFSVKVKEATVLAILSLNAIFNKCFCYLPWYFVTAAMTILFLFPERSL